MALNTNNLPISAYSKLLEYLNPLFNGRMGCKQAVQTIQKAHCLFARMLDKQLGNIGPIYGFYIRISRNLPQGTCQCTRVPCHLGCTGISQVFSFPGNGKPHQGGKEIADGRYQ